MIKIGSNQNSAWDLVSLGEILLRFDPGDDRIHNARTFRVHDGGAEYNVARNLAKVFKRKTAVITALVDNALGRLAEDFAHQAAVDTSEIIWRDQTANGANLRNGLYFMERGFGMRPPDSCFDRSFTPVSNLKTSDIGWRRIFDERGTKVFHTGGVFAGLSEICWQTAAAAADIARQSGVTVSYDLNYRDSLWKNRGGKAAANEINRKILPFVDIVFGTIVEDFEPSVSKFDKEAFGLAAARMQEEFPNLKIIVSTLRDVESASLHSFGAACFAKGRVTVAKQYRHFDVFDRVGSGDAFVSGFLHSLLGNQDEMAALDCGAAHAVLTMTTPGDNSSATVSEIAALMQDESAVVKR